MIKEKIREIKGPNGIIRGMVHYPCDDFQNVVCLFLHGYFSSNRIGPSRLYVLLSRELVKLGTYVWRFDCSGFGESDGLFEAVTYERKFTDYKFLIGSITNEHSGSRIILISHSMSSSLAIRLAQQYQEIAQIVLISPILGNYFSYEKLFSPEQIDQLLKNNSTIRKSLLIKKEFMDNIERDDIFDIAKSLKDIEITVIFGSEDEFTKVEQLLLICDKIGANKIIKIESADHNFLNSSSRKDLLLCFGNKSFLKIY